MSIWKNELPLPGHPLEYDPSTEKKDYFYEHVIKPMIPDFIKMMNTGLKIDYTAVDELREVVTKVLEKVSKTLRANALMINFMEYKYPIEYKKYEEEVSQSYRDIEYYLKEYDFTKIDRRTALINYYLTSRNKADMKQDKWTVADIKNLHDYYPDPFFDIDYLKNVSVNNPLVKKAMKELAERKVEIWNRPRKDKLKEFKLMEFNPGSAQQKQQFFKWLGHESPNKSKTTGEDSWNRASIEELLKNLDDDKKDLKEVLQAFIDHSYSAIIKNNFIEAFDRFTLEGRLHGNIKLFGAKSLI